MIIMINDDDRGDDDDDNKNTYLPTRYAAGENRCPPALPRCSVVIVLYRCGRRVARSTPVTGYLYLPDGERPRYDTK